MESAGVDPHSVDKHIIFSEAQRVRFLPPCACEFPPAFSEPATSVSQMVQTSACEEGTSHLIDDGWAEAQRKIDVLGIQLVDLGIAVEAIPDRVASDFGANCVAQDFGSNLCSHVGQDFMDLLNIEDDEVAHNQSLDMLDFMSYTDSVAVHHSEEWRMTWRHF